MDVSQFDVARAAETPRPLPIMAPNGEPTDIVLQVLGYDNASVVEAVRALDRDSMVARGKVDMSAYREDRKRARVKAALVGWENLGIGEEETEFSAAAVDQLLGNPGFSWIIDQVEDFAGNRANLFPEPPKA